jgi:hypothetical protein
MPRFTSVSRGHLHAAGRQIGETICAFRGATNQVMCYRPNATNG